MANFTGYQRHAISAKSRHPAHRSNQFFSGIRLHGGGATCEDPPRLFGSTADLLLLLSLWPFESAAVLPVFVLRVHLRMPQLVLNFLG